MCNEQRRRIALGQVRDDWSQTRIPLRFPEGLPNLAALDSIRITDTNAIIRAARPPHAAAPDPAASAAELVMRRWSWPGGHARPVYNVRSEAARLPGHRCLIVADGFYEFTAPDGWKKGQRKDKWLFTAAAADWFCIAGVLRDTGPDDVGEAYAMLTCEPGPDVAPYHSRQIVVLADPAAWAAWLDPAVPAATLCRPSPAGTLTVGPAPPGAH